MTHELESLLREDRIKYSNEMNIDTHEKFNLRDLTRLFLVYTSPLYENLSKEDRLFRAFEINCAKFISEEYRLQALDSFKRATSIEKKFNSTFLIKNNFTDIDFYLPLINQTNGSFLKIPKNISEEKSEEEHKHVMTTPYNLTNGVYAYYLYLLSL